MEREEVIPKSYPTNLLDKDWTKRKCYFLKPATDFIAKVHDLEVRDDDVWLVTLPKCGTTWMQELLWLVMNNFDFAAAKAEHLELRTPFMEFDFLLNRELERAFKPIEVLKSPRLIKSHLPLPLLPAQLWQKKQKIIYVYRNPKDAWVSHYYHGLSIGFHVGKTIDQRINEYMEKDAPTVLPFEHVTEFYQLRNEPWLYYTSFERMKSNLRAVIEDICKFLNKTITEEQMLQMLHHLSFEEMKVNPKINHQWEFEQQRLKLNRPYESHNFVRKGQVNGYKDDLTPELIAKVDHFIDEQLMPHNVTLNELLLLNED